MTVIVPDKDVEELSTRTEENVLEDEVTYGTLIFSAAESLYSLLSESSIAAGTYRKILFLLILCHNIHL